MASRLRSYSSRNKAGSTHDKALLTKSQPLEIIPPEVVFKDIQVNQYYEITVEIRNLTNNATRIRILQTKNPNFKVLYTLQPEIAPGLSMIAKVKYQCKELKNETEMIKIVSDEGFVVQFPVRVYKMESQILFQPFVNMGFLKVGRQHNQIISIKNHGKASGSIEFSHPHGSLISIQPKNLKIAAKQQSKITVKYKPVEAGLFKGVINLKSDSILVKDQIDLHATSVDFARFVIDDKGNQTLSFDFGTLFVGEENVMRAFIVNNSPKKMKFKTFFRKGYLTTMEEFAMVQTPSEIGSQQSQRVMFFEPQIGEVEPFKEYEFKIICKTRIGYRDRVYTKNYALTGSGQENSLNHMKNNTDFKPENIHEYSVMVNIEEDEPMILQLKANAICPQIKISDQVFKFGDCLCKEKRELQFTIENKNPISKADISFPKIPNFLILPATYCLRPRESHTFRAIFEPKTIGKLDTTQLAVINKLYEVELRCFGISTSGGSRSRLKQQEGLPQNINQSKKMQPMKTRVKAFSVTDKTFVSQMRKSTQQQEVMKMENLNHTANKQRFNQYLVNKRIQRGQKQKDQEVQKRWSLYQSKLKDLGISSKLQERVDDEGIPENPPIDYEFQTGIETTKIANQRVPLPESKQRLYVIKHIGDYEPAPIKNSSERYSKGTTDAPKKNWPSAPLNYNHKREIAAQLTAEELSQIEVATNTLSFGEVYIKSSSPAYFWIRNSTKKTISVKLLFKDNELKKSYNQPQIIPSCSEAGFEVIFSKDTLGDFRTTVKYLINDQHEFDMTVTAKCVPVCIQSDRSNIKFQFDEQSLEMSTKETIRLTNPGNSDATFKFALGKQKHFLPTINEGKIKAKETIEVPIYFTTPEIKVQKSEYVFNERIIVKVLDGAEVAIACACTLHDPKFNIKPLTVANPSLCVGHEFNDVIELKNTSKYPTVFHITGKVLQINEKIKINPDETKKFKVKFASKQVNTYDAEVIIQPRCGIPKNLTTTLNVVEPKITFSKQEIDMGILVVQGISGIQKFTVINENDIQMPLVIDLRPKSVKDTNPRHIENVSIKLLDDEEALDVVAPTLKSEGDGNQFLEGQNLVGQEIDEDELQNSEDDEEQIVEKNEDEYRRYKLPLKPKKVYQFQVQFLPKDVDKYEIELPLSIEGSKALIENGPVIICEGIKPQFLFDPSLIDFKRKIVTKPERSYPKYINITISNLDGDDCSWQLHDEEIKKEGVFTIQKNKGNLKGNETLQLKASFNPYAVGQYNYKLPLFIKNKNLTQPLKYVDVVMKGTATLPNLYFNKRQVIMPVVPLGVQTISTFKILNDGYENCNLKCQFIDDVANLDVKVLFPEGSNIGITRQKLKIDLVWKYHKPISFCLRLQFTDDLNRTFVIPVSGTTDNCILTNYVYFLRNQNKYTIKTQGQLQLTENVPETSAGSGGLVRKNSSHSLRSNVTGRSIMSYLGVNPISPSILSNTIDYINRYLNANMLTTPIKDFPGSFIQNDGQQIFEVIQFVSSKSSNYPWRYHPIANEKPLSRVNKIYNQYNELIKLLKIEGAHLNHIRPQYLLSYSDLNLYLSNLPPEKAKFYMPSLLKINTGLYNYLSLQSWITLLYQIFKIYILARVTPKNFKSHLPKITDIPKFYIEQSNFLSNSQSILFFWVEQAILEVLLEERRLTNFDKDFKDGVAIGSLLQKYAGLNILKKMKMVCTSEQDFKENAQIVCQGLAEIGLQNHISPKDISNPLQRQMLMFILHLYVYLPFYVPKQDPVVFKCILGEEVIRTIQLTNPSNKPVTYTVKYEGSDDFQLLNDDRFRIQPREIFKFQVKFVSRISNQVTGKIMFINVKENSLTAAALVFELKSDIIGRTSDRIWNISGILYEQVQFPIQVYNKFTSAQMVDFTISYQTQYIFETRGKKNQNPPLQKDQQIQTIYGKQDNIKIRKNGTVSLLLNYIPTSYFTTKTTIFFLNSIIGEFQHQIISTVQPPAPISQIRPPMTLSVDQIINWQYGLNSKNQQVGRAKKAIESLKKKKGGKEKEKVVQYTVNESFTVEIAPNPYINAKELIVISEKVKEEKKTSKDSAIVDTENKVPFTIVCKNPVYEFSTFVLICNKSKTDVRRYKVIFTVQPKPLKAILQMNVPARGEVVQNLPIVNNTERDWNIKVLWQPDSSKNGNYFSIPTQYNSSFPVKRNNIGNFPVTFKPKWAHQAEAKLVLTNPLTLDHFEYQIMGHGQQPLAQEHIEIKCEAKEIVKKEIIVKNPYQQRPVSLNVETDLMNCQSSKKLVIQSGGKEKFEFTVQPMLCGQYTGSITFFEDDGPQYIWYTVSVITNYPQAYKVLNLETEIRKKILHQIHIPYDHSEESSFQVVINGVGLIGDPTVSMKPDYDNTYILQYLPLEVGAEKGSICFINPGVGQVLFELDLVCHEKAPVVINNLKSPLGVSTTISAELENPTFSKAVVKIVNSNPQQFVIKSHTIRLQPQEKKKVQIEYVPASLDTVESAKIVFTSKEIGDWVYELNGTGQMPIPFNTYSVYNGLYEEHSDSIKFRNPFKYEIVVGVKLVDESQKNIFKLMNHGKTKFQLDANGILQIPFSFIPSACKMYTCKVIVLITEKIYWTFPIRGVTQVNQGKVIASLSTPCRQSTSEFVQIGLDGVDFSKGNKFDFSFENIPSQYEKMMEKFLLVDCTKNSMKHAKDMLQFEFGFKPMKPCKISFDFLITKQEGSRWRYRLNLEGTDPEVDDIIEIQSNLLVTSTISFKMTNIEKNSTPFKAKFTSDSAHQFSVQPKEGNIAPFGTKGTNFYVSYTPVEYGKEKKGRLIIETADMFWSYLLKGSLPKYVPPKLQATRSRIISDKR